MKDTVTLTMDMADAVHLRRIIYNEISNLEDEIYRYKASGGEMPWDKMARQESLRNLDNELAKLLGIPRD